MEINDSMLLRLCKDYRTAVDRCRSIDAEVAQLAEEGDHKRKNRIIHTEGVKASQKRNVTLRKLQEFLETDF